MDDKYKKLVDTLPKESEDLWFEYNLAVNKIIQENQRLKEQYCERTDCGGRLGNSKKVERLIQENKELQEKYNIRSKAYNNILLENASLHDKIDKAIEYINGAWEMGCYTKTVALYSEELEELLEILKDGDVDEE